MLWGGVTTQVDVVRWCYYTGGCCEVVLLHSWMLWGGVTTQVDVVRWCYYTGGCCEVVLLHSWMVWDGVTTQVDGVQPKLPAGMGTWPKLADRSVWAHGNTRKGRNARDKAETKKGHPGVESAVQRPLRSTPTHKPPGSAPVAPVFLAFFSLPSAYCHVPILSGLLTLAMCPYRPGVWVVVWGGVTTQVDGVRWCYYTGGCCEVVLLHRWMVWGGCCLF